MKYLIRDQFQTLAVVLIVGFALSACGDDANNSETRLDSVDSSYRPTVFISFESGPNAGRYQYIVDESNGGKIELKYNQINDVTFLELRGLVSIDGSLKLDELRRFTKGQLLVGSNQASTWRAEEVTQKKECGVLNLRDRDNSQAYNNGFGKYDQCGNTTIDSITGWKNADDSLTKMRITKGSFSDRVRFDMSMDSGPFQRFETDVLVDFDLLETATRF